MKQALHIFRKDVRFLWAPVALSLALTAAFAWSVADRRAGIFRFQLTLLLILSWYYLAAAAVHKEGPAGDRQFWTTRPYRWTSLVVAKALFLVLFVHLPLLASDLTILLASGLEPSWAALAWRQLGAAALITVPAAAVASITRNLSGFAMTVFGGFASIVAAFAAFDTARSMWPQGDTLRGLAMLLVLMAAGAATLVWQYARRRTEASRFVAAGGLMLLIALVIAPPPVAPAIVDWPTSEAPELRAVRLRQDPKYPPPRGLFTVNLRIEGIPNGLRAIPEWLSVDVDGRAGTLWTSGWIAADNPEGPRHVRWNANGPGAFSLYFTPALADRLEPDAVKLRVKTSILVASRGVSIPVDGAAYRTSILGRCAATRGAGTALEVTCWSSAWVPSISVDGSETRFQRAYLERLQSSPIVQQQLLISSHPGTVINLAAGPPVGRIAREITIPLPPGGRP